MARIRRGSRPRLEEDGEGPARFLRDEIGSDADRDVDTTADEIADTEASTDAEASRVIDLARFGVPRLLFAIASQRFTGHVEFLQSEPSGHRTLYVRDGRPITCNWQVPGTWLGDILLARGVVDADELASALRMQATLPRRLGELLVHVLRIDPAEIDDALREQCEHRLESLFAASDGEVRVVAHEVLDDGPEGNMLALIARGIARYYDADRIDAEMGDVLSLRLSAAPRLAELRDAFEFTSPALAIVDALLARPEGYTLDELAVASASSPGPVRAVVFTLWVAELAQVSEHEVHSGPIDVFDLPAMLERLEARFEAGRDPMGVLSLDLDADTRAIEMAWQALDHRLDPEASPPELRERVERMRGLLAEVRTTARDRREALALMSSARLLDERKYKRALPLFEELAELRPDDLRVRAGLLWCALQASPRTETTRQATLVELTEVVERDPSFADAHYYRGYVLLELGKEREALGAFELCHRLDPTNIDAERQARGLRGGVQRGKGTRPPSRPRSIGPEPSRAPHPYWSGAWPYIWIISGVTLVVLVAAQIVLRMDW